MRPVWGDDYCHLLLRESATQTGKEMQFFGARANLAKCLLYAINGGIDEKSREHRSVRNIVRLPVNIWITMRLSISMTI